MANPVMKKDQSRMAGSAVAVYLRMESNASGEKRDIYVLKM
jgi:hypothetical protein